MAVSALLTLTGGIVGVVNDCSYLLSPKTVWLDGNPPDSHQAMGQVMLVILGSLGLVLLCETLTIKTWHVYYVKCPLGANSFVLPVMP